MARDTAYEGLPYRRRHELHERVGMAVEARADDPEDEAELLSLHFFHAHDYGRAWRYSCTAGQRAQTIYANVEAASFYERAIDSAQRLHGVEAADVAKLYEDLGDVRLRLGEFDHAGMAYRRSRKARPRDAVEEAAILLKEAMVPLRLARYPATIRWLNRGLRVLEDVSGPAAAGERARIAVWCATVRQRQRRPREAMKWAWRAIADVEQATDARHALGHAYVILDNAYLALGRGEEAEYLPLALSIYEELNDLDWVGLVLNNMGSRTYTEGRWDETLDLAGRACEAWETIGDRWRASWASFNIADILADQGRLDEAEPLARAALRIWRASKTPVDIADATALLGRIAARSGRFEEAHSLLREARDLYAESGEAGEALRTDAAIAECLVLEGDPKAAIELVDESFRRAAETEGLSGVRSALPRMRGWALLQLGRFADAQVELENSLAVGRQADSDFGLKSADYEVALTLDAMVRLGTVTDDPALVDLATERDAIVGRLGIVTLPAVPLPA
jgi:tetratricopeptide (TPR) repeat protein